MVAFKTAATLTLPPSPEVSSELQWPAHPNLASVSIQSQHARYLADLS